ncbi:ulilysin [Penicillium sp. DV-2018c]|nr:ulilysin [Penicillium sp. DV-2018c]
MGDWNQDGRPDLVAIKKSNTGSKSTEVHILSGASNFQNFILHTGTPLHETDDTFDFVMGDWNQDGRPDLVAIKKSNTGSKSTEVHILSGASNFQDFILHTGTSLQETDDTFDFVMGDWNQDGRPDLVAIKKSNTGSKSTEVLILSGAWNFQNVILPIDTPLHETDATFDFVMGDWNQDGRLDLIAIKKNNTGSKSTEVHILSG